MKIHAPPHRVVEYFALPAVDPSGAIYHLAVLFWSSLVGRLLLKSLSQPSPLVQTL